MDILKKINKMRINKGWSIYRLSEEAELAHSTVINMFNRETLPSITTLESLCSALGVTLSEFFLDDEGVETQQNYKEEIDRLYSLLTLEQQKIIVDLMKVLADK